MGLKVEKVPFEFVFVSGTTGKPFNPRERLQVKFDDGVVVYFREVHGARNRSLIILDTDKTRSDVIDSFVSPLDAEEDELSAAQAGVPSLYEVLGVERTEVASGVYYRLEANERAAGGAGDLWKKGSLVIGGELSVWRTGVGDTGGSGVIIHAGHVVVSAEIVYIG